MSSRTNIPDNRYLALVPSHSVSYFLVASLGNYLWWAMIQGYPRLINIVYPLRLCFKAIFFKDKIEILRHSFRIDKVHAHIGSIISFTQ